MLSEPVAHSPGEGLVWPHFYGMLPVGVAGLSGVVGKGAGGELRGQRVAAVAAVAVDVEIISSCGESLDGEDHGGVGVVVVHVVVAPDPVQRVAVGVGDVHAGAAEPQGGLCRCRNVEVAVVGQGHFVPVLGVAVGSQLSANGGSSLDGLCLFPSVVGHGILPPSVCCAQEHGGHEGRS